jgi:hypothetical protein
MADRTFSTRFAKSLWALGALVALPSESAVNACRDDAGRLHFFQFDCPPDTERIEQDREDRSRLSLVTTAPLSPDEERALARLEQTLNRERAARARERSRSAEKRARAMEEQRALCDQAERRLDDLSYTRRKGYSAREESRLEAEEARWRAARRAAC